MIARLVSGSLLTGISCSIKAWACVTGCFLKILFSLRSVTNTDPKAQISHGKTLGINSRVCTASNST